MAVPKETHLERLAAAEKILYHKLSDIKNIVECGGIIWQPPGWGMEYWKKGLRLQLGSKPVHFKELDTDDLRTMMERFDKFVDHVKDEQGLDIEPPPTAPGPGVGHYLKYVASASYRRSIADIAMEDRVRNALDQLRATKDEARQKLEDLEKQEREIITEGRAERSVDIRKRLAGRLAQLRKDIKREDSTVKFAARQLGRCEDYLHTKKMARLAGTTGLPDTEEIVENQAEAELAIEAADAAADAAMSVEFDYLDEEALECMKEFDEPEGVEIANTDDVETVVVEAEAEADAMADFDGEDKDEPAKTKKSKHTA